MLKKVIALELVISATLQSLCTHEEESENEAGTIVIADVNKNVMHKLLIAAS